jgi:hypothetical protein
VGALTAASNVVGAGQQLVPTTQANNNQPSVMIVEIIGYGGSQGSDQNQGSDQTYSGSQPSDQNSDDPKKCADPKNDDCKQP